MNSRLIVAGLLSILVSSVESQLAHADDNPLRDFFPYGVYLNGSNPSGDPDLNTGDREAVAAAIDRACQDLADHHMNAAWPNNLPSRYIPLWLQAGEKHGIRVVPQGGGPPMFLRPGSFAGKEDMVKKVGDFYQRQAEAHRDKPALLAWSITEENAYLPWFHEGMRDLTRLMETWDPKHPLIVMDNQAPGAWMVAKVIRPKVLVMDSYPFFVDGLSGPINPLGQQSLWRRQCRRMRHAAESVDAPYWMIGQACAETHFRDGARIHDIWRYPTPTEIRWQLWAAVQEGTKGFFYFRYSSDQPRDDGSLGQGLRDADGKDTDMYREASELGRVLKMLAPLLLKLDVAPVHQQVEYWENTVVSAQTHVHRETGERFMSVVNNECSNIQRVGVEVGYWPHMLDKEDRLFDLRSGRKHDYSSIKLATLRPGDGTIYFVGTEEEWKTFSKDFFVKRQAQ